MKSFDKEIYEKCPSLEYWERKRWNRFNENQDGIPQAPSMFAQQSQQIMSQILEIMQRNPSDPRIVQQLPGLITILNSWHQELQTNTKQQPEQPPIQS